MSVPRCLVVALAVQFAFQVGASADDPKKSSDVLVTAPPTGNLLKSDEPEWSLLADASATSLDLEKPVAGLGLERSSPHTLLRFGFKKNLAENSVEANRGSETFGTAVLAPSLANFSVLWRFEYRRGFINCDDCRKPDRRVYSKTSYGPYGQLEGSKSTAMEIVAVALVRTGLAPKPIHQIDLHEPGQLELRIGPKPE